MDDAGLRFRHRLRTGLIKDGYDFSKGKVQEKMNGGGAYTELK